eukprot:155703-Amphidinium_carterae.1
MEPTNLESNGFWDQSTLRSLGPTVDLFSITWGSEGFGVSQSLRRQVALMNGQPRNATCLCDGDLELLYIRTGRAGRSSQHFASLRTNHFIHEAREV